MSKLFFKSFLLFLSKTLCDALLASSSESLLFCEDCDEIRTILFLFLLPGEPTGEECLDTGALWVDLLRDSSLSTVTTSISSSSGRR